METVRLETGGIRWSARSEHADWVRDELAVLAALGADEIPLPVVKRKHTRAVFRLDDVAPGTVYLKWGRARAPHDRLRNRIWPSRLATEWARLSDLRRLGVPTAEPIAWGERSRHGLFQEEWLAVGEVRGPTLAAHAAAGFPPGGGLPAALTGDAAPTTIGRWVRRIHDAGALHTDFHAENLIVSPEHGSVVPIDVDDVVVGRVPGLDARARSLAQLIGRDPVLSLKQRRALLEAYAEADGGSLPLEPLLELVEAHRERDGRRHRRHRVRRSLARSSSRFDDDLCGAWRLRTRRSHDRAASSAALRAVSPRLDGAVDGSILPAGLGEAWLCHRPHGVRGRLWSLLGRSRAVRAWQGANALEAWGLPGPHGLALVRPPRLAAAHRASAVLFEDDGAIPLAEALREAIARGAPAADDLGARIGRTVGALHRAGLAVTGGPCVGDLVVVPGEEPVVRPSLQACERLRWWRRAGGHHTRAPASRLAREVADLAGDGVGGRVDDAYRDAARPPGREEPSWWTSVSPSRIAIIKVGAIGDVVNTLPMAVRLRDRFPHAKIAWIVGPVARPVLEGHPAIDRLIEFPRHRFRDLPRMVREIRAFGPDLAIDAGRQLKSAVTALLSGARWRLGFDRDRSKEQSWRLNNVRVPPAWGRGLVLDHYLELARALGCPDGPPRWDLGVPEAAHAEARRLLAGAREPVVAFAVGATKRANLWPAHRLAALCAHVRERGGTPVLVGDGRDRPRADLIATLAGRGVRDLTGRTDLKQLAALFQSCRAVVCQDSGPMHIAVAVGARTVAVFGAANPLRTGPHDRLDAVRRTALPCAPCGKRVCPLGTRACMGLLPVEPVKDVLDDVLAGRRPPPAPVPAPDMQPARRREGPWRIAWDQERPPGTLMDRLHALGELFGSDRLEVYNVCATSETGRFKDPEVGPLFVKRYKTRGRVDALRNLFRTSRARRSFRAGRRLVEMGLPTGRPLALAERRSRGRVVDSFVVTEEVPHLGNVLEVFRDRARSPAERARFTRALALHLRELHDRGIYARDCKGTNLLVQERDGALAFAQIDLDRQAFDRRVSERDAVRNFVYLNASFGGLVSDRDRLRFLKAYLGEGFRDRARVRRIARAVRTGTAERLPRRRPPLEVR